MVGAGVAADAARNNRHLGILPFELRAPSTTTTAGMACGQPAWTVGTPPRPLAASQQHTPNVASCSTGAGFALVPLCLVPPPPEPLSL